MRVRYGPRALRHLDGIRQWIAEQADADTVTRIVADLVARCDALASFSHRGTPRDDIHPGLRTIAHRRRDTIGYVVLGGEVVIVGVRSAGQDEAPLAGLPD